MGIPCASMNWQQKVTASRVLPSRKPCTFHSAAKSSEKYFTLSSKDKSAQGRDTIFSKALDRSFSIFVLSEYSMDKPPNAGSSFSMLIVRILPAHS